MATTKLKISGQDASTFLNNNIECDDLAVKLGMVQIGGKKGNWRSPLREDSNPSVTMYPPKGGKGSTFWDHTDKTGGGPIDLMIYHSGGNMSFVDAVMELCRMYGFALDKPERDAAPAPRQTLVEYIAENCLQAVRNDEGRAEVLNYLEGRGITRDVLQHALNKRTLGLNTYCSDKFKLGEVGYGGLAVAFIVRHHISTMPVALELRYLEPATNGGQKSGSQGEKKGHPWCMDWRRVQEART
ncbi:MAG: hypothetical protein Q8R07_02990, partial [Candidatus Uhrbacteria bacterium]|nr:hypothetical protein [Candidatus Uhrbacteria bacterium]